MPVATDEDRVTKRVTLRDFCLMRVPCRDGGLAEVLVLVDPGRCGLGVTQRITSAGTVVVKSDEGYTVTHLASGYRLPFAGSIAQCRRLIDALRDVTDWRMTARELRETEGAGLKRTVDNAILAVKGSRG